MTATLKGADVLQRRFNAMTREVRGQVLLDGARAGAGIIRDDARARAPRGATGRMADGIEIETNYKTSSVARVDIGWLRSVFYGIFQELGTKWHGARPHLRPAFDTRQGEATREVGRHLKKGIDRGARA